MTNVFTARPTEQSYPQLLQAFSHFNMLLFKGRLPPVLFTLVNKPNSKGYFHAEHFEHATMGVYTDEISLNPTLFRERTDRETLSTLVHEMVHLWQMHHGNPPRAAYHNAEWADKMQDVGLMPSSTGQLGGKRTGAHMTHYIIPGGPFDTACKKLLDSGFAITWKARPTPPKAGKGLSGKRVKYMCGTCDARVWGKADLHIMCGDCRLQLLPV